MSSISNLLIYFIIKFTSHHINFKGYIHNILFLFNKTIFFNVCEEQKKILDVFNDKQNVVKLTR